MLKAPRLIPGSLEYLETLAVPLQRGFLIAEIPNCREYACTIKPSIFAAPEAALLSAQVSEVKVQIACAAIVLRDEPCEDLGDAEDKPALLLRR